jgi:putative phage-type endonuclease
MNLKYKIGGKNIGAILGLDPFQTPMQLYLRKLGLIPPPVQNEAMKCGLKLESEVARRYAKETGSILYPSINQGFNYKRYLVHPEHPWWIGVPDRAIVAISGFLGVLEVKVVKESAIFLYGDPPNGLIPERFKAQVAWYMPLLEVEWADIAILIGEKYAVYRVNRDREYENYLRDAALSFINNHLIPKIPPEGGACERINQKN